MMRAGFWEKTVQLCGFLARARERVCRIKRANNVVLLLLLLAPSPDYCYGRNQ